jgi:uncharacterized protein (TIRG00374 family)
LVLLDIAARAMRWRAVLRPLKEIAPAPVLAHTLIGYLANTAMPARLGEVVRSYTLGTREGVSKATVGGSIVVERMLDVASLALVSLVALFMTPVGEVLVAGIGLAVGLCVVAFVLLVFITSPGTRQGIAARVHERHVPDRFRPAVAVLVRLVHGLAVVRSRRAMAKAFGWSMSAWVITGIAFAAASRAVGLELSVPQVVLFVAATNLITVIPAGPAYVGTFELAALSVAAGMGVPAPDALAMAVLVHASIVVVTTLGGLIAAAGFYASSQRFRRREVPIESPISQYGGGVR